MPIVPTTNIGKIEFYESHIGLWTSLPTQIGLLASDCTALAALIDQARKDYDEQKIALDAAKAATQRMNDSVRAMHTLGAADIAKIKAFAEATNNPNVYTLANLPAPTPGSAVPPPGQPTDLSVGLDATTGAIKLAWKVINPPGASGTSYIVRRKLPTQTQWQFVGVTGKKAFTDATFNAGPDSVQYTVQAQRSDSSGLVSNILQVNFGTPAGGGLSITSQYSEAA